MQLYSANVRLHGSLLHEVYKTDLTASEVIVLRVLHGDDAVADIVHTGQAKNRTDAEERARLTETYGAALAGIDDVKSMNGVFGVAAPLPIALPGIDHTSLGKVQTPRLGRPPREKIPQAPSTLDLATDEDIDAHEFEVEVNAA